MAKGTAIQSTYQHLPGVGVATEQRLRSRGLRTWADLKRECAKTISARSASTRARVWLEVLAESESALAESRHHYFIDRLPVREHWRVLVENLHRAVYVDIETTGLSPKMSAVTVIGTIADARLSQWRWPERNHKAIKILNDAPLLVTYNGKRFDLPFLRQHFPDLQPRGAHIDLRDLASAAGVGGTQKEVEERLGIQRPFALQGLTGAHAVELWTRAIYGDAQSYRMLLEYNKADVALMPEVALRLCQRLANDSGQPRLGLRRSIHAISNDRVPAQHAALRGVWNKRRIALSRLLMDIERRHTRLPRIVGIDLRGNPRRPTGWALADGHGHVRTSVLFDDDSIVESTLAVKPDVVSIDAPLFLPKGRTRVGDDDPARRYGIVRRAERVLWSRGVPVYPALIQHMQGLTERGISIAARLRERGVEVIECYPGAAQDVLLIPRKGSDLELLRRGLVDFGFALTGRESHDELDAVTACLVGYFYIANVYEGIGDVDEGFMILPRAEEVRRW